MSEPPTKAKPRAKSSQKKKPVPEAPPARCNEPVVKLEPGCAPSDDTSVTPPLKNGKRKRTPDAPCTEEPESEPCVKKPRPDAEVIDLDAPPPVQISADTARYYVCHNHHTAHGSGHASTLVCATDIAAAQRSLDAWLVEHGLQPLAAYPYQLREIGVNARGGMIVSSDDAVRMDLTQPHQAHASGQKNVPNRLYTFQDIPFTDKAVENRSVVAGAVLVAPDEYDASRILTETLWNAGLLTRDVLVAPESMECVVVSALGPRASEYVIPLSLYMCEQ